MTNAATQTQLRWRLSPHWRLEPLENDSRYIFFNTVSDQRLRLSQEATRVAMAFSTEQTANGALDALQQSDQGLTPQRFDEIGLELQRVGVLIPTDSDSLKTANSTDSARLKHRAKRWINPFFLRWDIGNPTALLNRINTFGRTVTGTFGVMCAIVACILLPWLLYKNGAALSDYIATELPSSHLMIAIVCVWPFLKLSHELGHALVLRRLGGEVKRCGVTFLFFLPLPFVDASDSWNLTSRRQRIAVSMAGVLAEVILACVCLWAWQITSDGSIKALLTAVVMVVCFASLLINANPLMKFDGYHVLQDLLDTTSLYQSGTKTLKGLIWRGLGATRSAVPLDERWTLYALYGAAAALFRLTVIVGICIWFMRDIPLLGSALAGLLVFTAAVLPILLFIKESLQKRSDLFPSRRSRFSAVTVSVMSAAAVMLLPLPRTATVNGILAASASSAITSVGSGELHWMVQDGDNVDEGDIIAQLQAPEIDHLTRIAEMSLERQRLELERSVFSGVVDSSAQRAALEAAVETAKVDVDIWREKRDALVLRAVSQGVVSVNTEHADSGSWVSHGQVIGSISENTDPEIRVLIDQQLASSLASDPATVDIMLSDLSIPPVEATHRPPTRVERVQESEMALTRLGGGEIAVDEDMSPAISGEAFFASRLALPPNSIKSDLIGQRVMVRYTLEPKPLASQLMFSFQNTFFKIQS